MLWVSAVLGGLALVGFGVFLGVANLDRADKLASVAGVFVGAVGLVLSGYGIVLARRALRAPEASAGRQAVQRVHAAAGVDVIDTVGGSVRLGNPSSRGGASAGATTPRPSGEQVVRDITSGGHIRVVRGVDGDVDSAS